MTQTQESILLAGAMIGIAFLAVFDVIPERYAQFAPLALIALFPGVWMSRDKACRCNPFKRNVA